MLRIKSKSLPWISWWDWLSHSSQLTVFKTQRLSFHSFDLPISLLSEGLWNNPFLCLEGSSNRSSMNGFSTYPQSHQKSLPLLHNLKLLQINSCWCALQSMGHGPAALASSRSLLEMQSLEPHPRLLTQNLHCNKIPDWFICTLILEIHYPCISLSFNFVALTFPDFLLWMIVYLLSCTPVLTISSMRKWALSALLPSNMSQNKSCAPYSHGLLSE